MELSKIVFAQIWIVPYTVYENYSTEIKKLLNNIYLRVLTVQYNALILVTVIEIRLWIAIV